MNLPTTVRLLLWIAWLCVPVSAGYVLSAPGAAPCAGGSEGALGGVTSSLDAHACLGDELSEPSGRTLAAKLPDLPQTPQPPRTPRNPRTPRTPQASERTLEGGVLPWCERQGKWVAAAGQWAAAELSITRATLAVIQRFRTRSLAHRDHPVSEVARRGMRPSGPQPPAP